MDRGSPLFVEDGVTLPECFAHQLREALTNDEHCWFSPFITAQTMVEVGGGMGMRAMKNSHDNSTITTFAIKEDDEEKQNGKNSGALPPPPLPSSSSSSSEWCLPSGSVLAVVPFSSMITVGKARRHLALVEVEYERNYPLVSCHSSKKFPLSLFHDSPSFPPPPPPAGGGFGGAASSSRGDDTDEDIEAEEAVPFFLYFSSTTESKLSRVSNPSCDFFGSAPAAPFASSDPEWSMCGCAPPCGEFSSFGSSSSSSPSPIILESTGSPVTTSSCGGGRGRIYPSSLPPPPPPYRHPAHGSNRRLGHFPPAGKDCTFEASLRRHQDHILRIENKIASELSPAETLAAYLGLMKSLFTSSSSSSSCISLPTTSTRTSFSPLSDENPRTTTTTRSMNPESGPTFFFFHQNSWMRTWLTSLPSCYDNGLELQWKTPTRPPPSSSSPPSPSLPLSSSQVLPVAMREKIFGFSRLDRKIVKEQECVFQSYQKCLGTLRSLQCLPRGIDLREEGRKKGGDRSKTGNVGGGGVLSFTDFIWCYNTVASRGFSFPMETWALMPYVDYFNYALQSNATMTVERRGKLPFLFQKRQEWTTDAEKKKEWRRKNEEGGGGEEKDKKKKKVENTKNKRKKPIIPRKRTIAPMNLLMESSEEEGSSSSCSSSTDGDAPPLPHRLVSRLSFSSFSASSSSSFSPLTGKDQVFIFYTTCDIRHGEEIFLCYGSYSDTELFMWYGFTLRPVYLPMKVEEHNEDISAREEDEEKQEVGGNPHHHLLPSPSSSSSLGLQSSFSMETRRKRWIELVQTLEVLLENKFDKKNRVKDEKEEEIDTEGNGSATKNENDSLSLSPCHHRIPSEVYRRFLRWKDGMPAPQSQSGGEVSSSSSFLKSEKTTRAIVERGRRSTWFSPEYVRWYCGLQHAFSFVFSPLENMNGEIEEEEEKHDEKTSSSPEDDDYHDQTTRTWLERLIDRYIKCSSPLTTEMAMPMWRRGAERKKKKITEGGLGENVLSATTPCGLDEPDNSNTNEEEEEEEEGDSSQRKIPPPPPPPTSCFDFLCKKDAQDGVRLDAAVRFLVCNYLVPLFCLNLPKRYRVSLPTCHDDPNNNNYNRASSSSFPPPPLGRNMQEEKGVLVRQTESTAYCSASTSPLILPRLKEDLKKRFESGYAAVGCFHPSSDMREGLRECARFILKMWRLNPSLPPFDFPALGGEGKGGGGRKQKSEASDSLEEKKKWNRKQRQEAKWNEEEKEAAVQGMAVFLLRSFAWMEWYVEARRSVSSSCFSPTGGEVVPPSSMPSPPPMMMITTRGKAHAGSSADRNVKSPTEKPAQDVLRPDSSCLSFSSAFSHILSGRAARMAVQVSDDAAALLYTLSLRLSDSALERYMCGCSSMNLNR